MNVKSETFEKRSFLNDRRILSFRFHFCLPETMPDNLFSEKTAVIRGKSTKKSKIKGNLSKLKTV